jgi:hypothetical protein
MKKITANLIVESIEDGLRFWVERLGFEKTVEVPHEGRLGFVILKRGPTELMLQSVASLRQDVPAIAEGPHRAVVYIEVADLVPLRKQLGDWPLVVPERTTFYGTREIIVKDPAGHVVFLSAHGNA